MSVESALIVHKAALPTAARLAADLAETGVAVQFPADFALDRHAGGWVPVTIDGQPSGFNFAVQPIGELDPADLPEGAGGAGDTLLSFGGQGSLSAETVMLIQEVLGRRYRAWLLIEDELLPPDEGWGPGAPLDEIHVDRRGSPATLAREVEAHVARHYPPAPARHAAARELLRQLVVPLLIFAALGGFYLWSQLK